MKKRIVKKYCSQILERNLGMNLFKYIIKLLYHVI